MNSRILLVEDEPNLALTISDLLTAEGYDVEAASDGAAGLAKAANGGFDLVILDVMLPKKTGFEVCRELRARGVETAILMLTAKTQVDDRVVGLKLGADDYLIKPFDPAELLARVEALLRRVQKSRPNAGAQFHFANIEVDFDRAEVKKNGVTINLAGKELQLLRYLVDHRGRVIPREEILQRVWEYSSDISSRTIDVHIAWLRQKLEDEPQSPKHIHTIRGKGYRFSP
ncbi:MAG: response regulator transcription factor [Acidobacteriaceae bacterium]|nr:response regulator transcription factor [Acidobacteriaceae bacterium]